MPMAEFLIVVAAAGMAGFGSGVLLERRLWVKKAADYRRMERDGRLYRVIDVTGQHDAD